MSGTRLTSPVALTSSRVPAIVWVTVAADWAWAADGKAAAPTPARPEMSSLLSLL